MKNQTASPGSIIILSVFGLFIFGISLTGQEAPKHFASLPDDVNKIVTRSCISCHARSGKFLARIKLNFTDWSNYSAEKQKYKAEKMYEELKKGAMPPKAARERRPDLIPTEEQIAVIKKWAESFTTGNK